MRKLLGFFLIILGVLGIISVIYRNSQFAGTTRPFSSYSLLTSSWETYKKQFLNSEGRVIDYSQGSITTSEGQSYGLLTSVWVDDKPTFDSIWKWTRENLKRQGDNLFGWKWGQRADVSFGFLEDSGINSASDADTDIALALILAARRWNDPSYISNSDGLDALKILNDVWNLETVEAAGQRYLTAGNWAKSDSLAVINPSYFAPYSWKIFATVDKDHDWDSLVGPAYAALKKLGQEPLDRAKAVGLPPDWAAVDLTTGQFKPAPFANLSTNYSFDAMRVPFRAAIDYAWNRDPRARDYLNSSFEFLVSDFKRNGKLAATYTHDGAVLNENESPAMYATSLSFLAVADSGLSQKVYQSKVLDLYSNSQNTFRIDLPYYDRNFLWFGTALYNSRLIKL